MTLFHHSICFNPKKTKILKNIILEIEPSNCSIKSIHFCMPIQNGYPFSRKCNLWWCLAVVYKHFLKFHTCGKPVDLNLNKHIATHLGCDMRRTFHVQTWCVQELFVKQFCFHDFVFLIQIDAQLRRCYIPVRIGMRIICPKEGASNRNDTDRAFTFDDAWQIMFVWWLELMPSQILQHGK